MLNDTFKVLVYASEVFVHTFKMLLNIRECLKNAL